MASIDIIQVLGLTNSTLGIDQVNRLKQSLNEYVCFEIQTNHKGRFALDNILIILAVSIFNRDGNIRSLLEAVKSVASTLHGEGVQSYDLSRELENLIDKLYPESNDSNESHEFSHESPNVYPIRCVLIDKTTGQSTKALLHKESVEIDGVYHDRDPYFDRSPTGWKYHVVCLES